MNEQEKRSVGSRVRAAYRFWSTDYQFIVMGPVCAIAAVVCAVVQAWLPAILFGIGAAYMGRWIVNDRRRRTD